MIKIKVAKRFKFSAAHRLPLVSEFDPCFRIHGHTFHVEVILAASDLDARKMVVHFDDIREKVGKYIDETFDHKYLNDVAGLEDPTTEAIAHHLFCYADGQFGGLLHAIKVEEGPNNWAEVSRC